MEARSINHRYSEIVPRLPRSLMALEDRVRRSVLQYVTRGRVDVNIGMEVLDGRVRSVRVNIPLAEQYFVALCGLRSQLGLASPVELSDITGLPDVLAVEENATDPEQVWPLLQDALEICLKALTDMRAREGANLLNDIVRRTSVISSVIDHIEKRNPVVTEEYREKISRRCNDLLPNGLIDEQRLAMEVVLVAERASITEEIVRARSHLAQIADTLRQEESVGRKLDFLLQEVNREVNTISSKSSDLSIAEAVVTAKSELEKIREQIQNLE